MISNASALPDDTELLKQIIVDLQSRYDKETGLLLEQIRLLRAQLYGRKSEKGFEGSQAQPLPLFDMPEPEVSVPGEKIEVPAHTRKKSGRKPLPEGLPRVEVVHDLAAEEKICSCGSELSESGRKYPNSSISCPLKSRSFATFVPNMPAGNVRVLKMKGQRSRSLRRRHKLFPSLSSLQAFWHTC